MAFLWNQGTFSQHINVVYKWICHLLCYELEQIYIVFTISALFECYFVYIHAY